MYARLSIYRMAPMGFFSLLSVLQCTVWDTAALNHRAQLSLMLVLTASAFRVAISSKTPPVAYLTLLDRYCLWTALLIILVAIQSRLISMVASFASDDAITTMDITPEYLDSTFAIIFAVMWLLVHCYYVTLCLHIKRHPERFVHDSQLADRSNAIVLEDYETMQLEEQARLAEKGGYESDGMISEIIQAATEMIVVPHSPRSAATAPGAAGVKKRKVQAVSVVKIESDVIPSPRL